MRAAPVLVCQRCVEPFVYPIDANVSLHLVKSEAELDDGADDTAQEADDAADVDEAPEKVVGSRHFDVLEQVEDELILNIPYVPRHDVCPGAPLKTSAGEPAQGADADKRPSPFAVLEKLKQKH
ncbi:Large ribosomal RNA subunit accumulation protein YceD [Bordetella sputigena]